MISNLSPAANIRRTTEKVQRLRAKHRSNDEQKQKEQQTTDRTKNKQLVM
jgi:hypothetical protein